jgi:hypothetical protein
VGRSRCKWNGPEPTGFEQFGRSDLDPSFELFGPKALVLERHGAISTTANSLARFLAVASRLMRGTSA